MIDLIKELPDIQGCYLLTPTGTLGCYRADRRFHPDTELRAALTALIEQWLQEDRAAAEGPSHSSHSCPSRRSTPM